MFGNTPRTNPRYSVPNPLSRIACPDPRIPRVAHTLVCMYAPIVDAEPSIPQGFWGGPGVADMKGDVGATRGPAEDVLKSK